MLNSLRQQLRTQWEGLEKVSQFTLQEFGLSQDYISLNENVHRALAEVTLAEEWLKMDASLLGEECGELLMQLAERKVEVCKNSRKMSIP